MSGTAARSGRPSCFFFSSGWPAGVIRLQSSENRWTYSSSGDASYGAATPSDTSGFRAVPPRPRARCGCSAARECAGTPREPPNGVDQHVEDQVLRRGDVDLALLVLPREQLAQLVRPL